MASSFDRLKELNLSRDEVNRIGEALKKEEFRKLLVDYVEEIQDPENRKIYEEEVKQLERERGEEVTFLHPTPGYVIKTSVDGNQKCFINICSNENINKPTSSPAVNKGARGLQWSLPHSLSPPREDLDNKGVPCQVFDVLFHPDTLHLASNNRDFRSMVNTIALEAVENNFNVNLDKKNIKCPKLSYKGVQRASIMRKSCKKEQAERNLEEQKILDKIYSDIDSQRNSNNVKNSPKKVKTRRNSNEDNSCYTTPKYIIKHRSHVDIQDFTEHKDAKLTAAVPRELIVEIELPLLKSSSDMNLDVTEKTVQLVSEKPAKYKLNLTLPYEVNEGNGTAKFDKDLKKLVITLPVKRKNIFDMARDDSGVESCLENDLNSPTNQESEEEFFEKANTFLSVIKNSDKPAHLVKNRFTEVRTKAHDDFLDASDLYNLPDFTCNVFENIVAFTFNVKNVDENTVFKRYSLENSLIKVKFTSVSSSFYPTCYAFYVKLSNHKFVEEEVTIETWDNNVILQIPLLASDKQLLSYLYGTNEDNMTEKFIEEPAIINKLLEKASEVPFEDTFQQNQGFKSEESDSNLDNQASSEDDNQKSKTSKKSRYEEELEGGESYEDTKQMKRASNAIDIFATSYESSGDELSASSFSPRKSKGILKRISNNRSKFGRSISESSLDDLMYSSLENYHGSIECVPEHAEEEEGMSSSMKKTVRFNDHVTRQLFRSNSSILGQKKKNQRKARNKKRAGERRYSESEASDIENKKEGDYQTNNNIEMENKVHDKGTTEKKDDVDIFHLEMNS